MALRVTWREELDHILLPSGLTLLKEAGPWSSRKGFHCQKDAWRELQWQLMGVTACVHHGDVLAGGGGRWCGVGS